MERHPILAKAGKSSWGGKVMGFVSDIEKTKAKLLASRAETLLQNLRLRFPGLPQTALDMSKIQYNKVYFLASIFIQGVVLFEDFYNTYHPHDII